MIIDRIEGRYGTGSQNAVPSFSNFDEIDDGLVYGREGDEEWAIKGFANNEKRRRDTTPPPVSRENREMSAAAVMREAKRRRTERDGRSEITGGDGKGVIDLT
jgi:hypothetical protein